ncbi:MAG: CHAP domain-containing protein [Hyphomonadaceae bacterium]|nr:CHAP domain-containing protein [Hyphomonadaceae bacterium]
MRFAHFVPPPGVVKPVHPAAALLMLAAAATACSTVAPPVGPYPIGTARPTALSGGLPSPRFVPMSPSQCVPFARGISGININGDANTWWAQAAGRYPQASRPSVGSVMVMRTSGLGHVAVVTRIVSDRVVLVDHANWHGRGEVAVAAPVRDVSPDNSWSQVNVWWLDTNSWGSKTYHVEGFILPR